MYGTPEFNIKWVSTGEIPVAYEVFEDNKNETKTLIPLLNSMAEKFKIEQPIIVSLIRRCCQKAIF